MNPTQASTSSEVHLRTWPAVAGLGWLLAGLNLLKRQPLALCAMAVTFVLLHLPVLLPVVGMALATVLAPFATLGLMAACREVADNRTPTPTVYIVPFQDPKQRRGLYQLGVANTVLTIGALALLLLLGPSQPTTAVNDASVQVNWRSVVPTLIVYIPIAVLMWFSPMLVGWHGVPVIKALFGSAVACWRNKNAMLVFLLTTTLLLMLVFSGVHGLLTTLGAPDTLTTTVTTLLGLVMLATVQAGIYATYTAIFTTPLNRA